MLLEFLVGSLYLLPCGAASAAPRPQGGSPDPLAAVVTQVFQTSAMVTGAAPGLHAVPRTSLSMGGSLQSAANSALAPFDSTAGVHLALGPGPSAPVRLALTAGAVNGGLGAPPFTPLYREGRVQVDVLLTLACARGGQWTIDAQAVIQATWGAGMGCAQVQIDVGDDGVTEATWGCVTPTHQLAVVGTAPNDQGLRIRIRATGEAQSWTTSTPDHFVANLILDCVPATVQDYGVDHGTDYGTFDLEGPVLRRGGEAPERRPSLVSREPNEHEPLSAVRA